METEVKTGSLPGAIRDAQWRFVGPFTLEKRIIIEMGLVGAMRHYDDECWSIACRAPSEDEAEGEERGPAGWAFRADHEPGQFTLYARNEQDLVAQIGWWYAGEIVTVYELGERRNSSRYRQYYRDLETFLRNENQFGQYLAVAYEDGRHGYPCRVVLSEGNGPRIAVGDSQGTPVRPGELSLPLPALRLEEYRQLQDGVRPSRLPRYQLLCARLRRELEAALQGRAEARQGERDGDRG
jgi:hypothetical protein